MADKEKAPALLIGFGKPAADDDGEEGAGALAGKALAKAIKSGDGQAIFEAFETLLSECDRPSEGEDEPDEDDEE